TSTPPRAGNAGRNARARGGERESVRGEVADEADLDGRAAGGRRAPGAPGRVDAPAAAPRPASVPGAARRQGDRTGRDRGTTAPRLSGRTAPRVGDRGGGGGRRQPTGARRRGGAPPGDPRAGTVNRRASG